jgi:hypothetical protein
MTTMTHPKIRKIRVVRPQSIRLAAANSWVVDMGTNIAGWCNFHFPAPLPPAATNLTLMHSERLVLDGGPDNGTITHAIQPLVKGAYEQTNYLFGEGTNPAGPVSPLPTSSTPPRPSLLSPPSTSRLPPPPPPLLAHPTLILSPLPQGHTLRRVGL